VIWTKWLFRNKLDEDGNITKNKARLVAKGYRQEEDFASIMQGEFEMSMMGELTFFLGLQIKKMEEGNSYPNLNTIKYLKILKWILLKQQVLLCQLPAIWIKTNHVLK